MPAGFKFLAVFNVVSIAALLLLGLWVGGYFSLWTSPEEGHEIRLVAIEAPKPKAQGGADLQAQAQALPERYRTPDPSSMRWSFRENGALQWTDPAQQVQP